MKNFTKWRDYVYVLLLLSMVAMGVLVALRRWEFLGLFALFTLFYTLLFFGFWQAVHKFGVRTEFDLTRVLGKDAKEALKFGGVGMLVYDDNYVVTWTSAYFKDHHIDIENKKVTAWIPAIKQLFDAGIDTVTGKSNGQVYEISRKPDAQILFVKDVTEVTELKEEIAGSQVVFGLMQLDNYIEYQSYENEEIIENINTHLRAPLITWAKDYGMFVRRLRSDRILIVLNQKIFEKVKADNFSILQLVKDEANKLDVSITLSMAFAYGTSDFVQLDHMVNELMELAQSRGGDQAAIRRAGSQVIFIGGNSELSTQRSKVRVRIMAQSIQEAIKESDKVFITGHVNSDFDCMGAAISMAAWCKALNRFAYIVLKDVPRDKQLQQVLDHYDPALKERVRFITPAEAKEKLNKDKDLVIMVDHSVPQISSGQSFLNEAQRILVIDHHRRNDKFVEHPMLTYIESSASSTCELMVELLQNTPNHVPIYEADATIMYLGVLVDTNRFKMHTSARTFETVAQLRNWGANAQMAEKALCEDLDQFKLKNELVAKGKMYDDRFMICLSHHPLSRTLMSQVSDAMLKIKGAQASFTIAPNEYMPERIAISARSDGSFNVQKIMEKMHGGGHFSAAALERADTTVEELTRELLEVLREELKNENHSAERC